MIYSSLPIRLWSYFSVCHVGELLLLVYDCEVSMAVIVITECDSSNQLCKWLFRITILI